MKCRYDQCNNEAVRPTPYCQECLDEMCHDAERDAERYDETMVEIEDEKACEERQESR